MDASYCTFCAVNGNNQAVTFDLSNLPTDTWQTDDGVFIATSPCGQASSANCGNQNDPMVQYCKGVGDLSNITVVLDQNNGGFDLTLHNGFDDPPMPQGRNAVYHFICDNTVPASNPPDYHNITETPPGFYNLNWRNPAACGTVQSNNICPPSPPVPPPVPPPTPCTPGSDTCVPSWKPTWNLRNSTVLYTCNNTGMHNVTTANLYGVVVYDWSNAKNLWANAHPMNSEELLTLQAEQVLAVDPGMGDQGYAPHVWVYRNTIKALNWYTSVRVKLDDPAYSSWFIKFNGASNTSYPGGPTNGQAQNGTFHVPTCDWYNNGTNAPRCSMFYHDQEQTPEHPGGGSAYPVDGACDTQCDCGPVNPCGEYIFDHRGGMVNNQTFRDWFVNEYMLSNETLFHKDPVTGAPQMIGLGWLDDSMTPNGPTEEDKNYIADTGASQQDMQEQVAAYQESMNQLIRTVIPLGGFFWQLMDGGGAVLNTGINATTDPNTCTTYLQRVCVANSSMTKHLYLYNIPNGGFGASSQSFTDYTAEFLLTRG